jgi:hypothetical protein
MRVEYEGKIYDTLYFPFFRMRQYSSYQVFGLRYPSGRIEKVIVINSDNFIEELRRYLEYLIREYMREDDEMTTSRVKKLKEDVYDLFGEIRC